MSEEEFLVNSNQRIIEIFLMLYNGDKLSINTMCDKYQTSIRTIQRDFSTIRRTLNNIKLNLFLIYDVTSKKYFLKNKELLSYKETIIITKIMLESRALTKIEMEGTINKLLSNLCSENKKIVKNSIANELLYYFPVTHHKNLIDFVWEITEAIAKNKIIEFDYQKNNGKKVSCIGAPVSLIFSEYYFYVVVYNTEFEEYLIYRVDRFLNFKETAEKIHLARKDRIEESKIREKIYFMYAGKEITFKFRYWGILEAAMDKFPNAEIVTYCNDSSVVIEVTAQEKGVLMWLLSQGSNVQVLSPTSFVETIKSEIKKMKSRYCD